MIPIAYAVQGSASQKGLHRESSFVGFFSFAFDMAPVRLFISRETKAVRDELLGGWFRL
jgi:hypothetical protein